MATLADRIGDWIVAAAQEASARGAIVGLSGGVDSAVTARLCKRALGGPDRRGELGMTYEQLDRALKATESGKTDRIAPQIMVRVKGMTATSAHKRVGARVCEVREQCICATKRT